MNHQIYGVILFAFILILIYLLNRINFNEGFENNLESIYIDNFNIYDNVLLLCEGNYIYRTSICK